MKILYHHRTRGDGAEGVHINEMCTAFRELGHTVTKCGPRTPKESGLSTGMRGVSSDHQKRISGTLHLFIRQFLEIIYNGVSFIRLCILLARHQPDFIYERFASYHPAGVLAARLFNTALILEVNATDAGRFPHSPLAFPRIAKWMENYCLRNATALAVVSSPLKSCVLDRGIKEDKVIVTPNAINARSMEQRANSDVRNKLRRKLGIDNDFVIGFVGSMRSWHGIDILAEAIPETLKRIPDATFLVVGSGEQEHLIRNLQNIPGFHKRILMTGGVSHAEAMELVSAMDIGLMPHSNDWGSPMKILEYMSMGVVTIAPDLAAIRDVLTENQTGMLFQPQNTSDLVSKIVQTHEDRESTDRISTWSKIIVKSKHTWTHNAEQVIEVLQRANVV